MLSELKTRVVYWLAFTFVWVVRLTLLALASTFLYVTIETHWEYFVGVGAVFLLFLFFLLLIIGYGEATTVLKQTKGGK